jgi:adenylosuccinate lyase
MIERYTRPEMGAIWTEDNKFRQWLTVEIAVCEAWAELGKIPAASLQTIKKKANFSVDRIEEIEKVVKHDVIAFLTSVAEYVGEDARFIHVGLTSYDIVDTALSLLIKQSLEKIRKDLLGVRDIIKEQALKHKMTVTVGRTHGVHAEPITLGIKLLVWFEEVNRHLNRIQQSLDVISVGRISGSVGTYIHLDPRVEEISLARLGLQPAKVSTQVLQRDRHAEVISTLAILAASLDKFATEIRHLQRTEVREVEEPFATGQKGSSAMPHKRNPVKCEQVSGLSRLLRGYAVTALENMPLWHERDISHSSAERVILPDATGLICYMLRSMARIVKGLQVYPERMIKNMGLTRGLAYSGQLLLDLTRKGVSREDAYVWVQRCSMRVWNEDKDFLQILKEDPDIARVLTTDEIQAAVNPELQLRNAATIFQRVFGH